MEKERATIGNVEVRERGLTRLPNIIAVGPPRTGTTWLDAVLRGHIGLPSDVKETQFFKWNYERGIDWYAWHFRDCPPRLPIMEICPSYFNFAAARDRIKTHVPDCKIVCTLRDPVERLYSVFRHYAGFSGFRSFEEMIADAPDLFDASNYVAHLREWYARFGRENVLVVLFEDLERSPQNFLDSICQFAGIPSFDVKTTEAGVEKINASPQAPRSRLLGMASGRLRGWLLSHRLHKIVNFWQRSPLWKICFAGGEEFGPPSPELERRLRDLFGPSVATLEELLGRDLSAWK
jgi:hypothetical protein